MERDGEVGPSSEARVAWPPPCLTLKSSILSSEAVVVTTSKVRILTILSRWEEEEKKRDEEWKKGQNTLDGRKEKRKTAIKI